MSEELKKDCLAKLIVRHARRNREGKSRMLGELCDDFKYERKYAIKLLGAGLPPGSGRVPAGPERRYEGIEPVVRQIWLCAEQPCGKRLVPILQQWLPFYELRHGALNGRDRQLVRQISAGHRGPAAGPRAGAAGRTGAGWHQAGQSAALQNSHPHGRLGLDPTRLFGGRPRGPLWREHGR